MWELGLLIGIVVAPAFWWLVLVPREKVHQRRRLEVIEAKMKRLEESKAAQLDGNGPEAADQPQDK